MQSVSSKIWTRVAVSISYDDTHYTTKRKALYFLYKVNKFRDRSRGGHEGSLFDSYYTNVSKSVPLLSLDCSTWSLPYNTDS